MSVIIKIFCEKSSPSEESYELILAIIIMFIITGLLYFILDIKAVIDFFLGAVFIALFFLFSSESKDSQ